jgi:hypothetical protein
MTGRELLVFRIVFIIAAFWNLAGGIPGYFNTAAMFEQVFGRELTDPVMFTVYKGAWGTTFLYFIGYLIVTKNPMRHTGIVILGGVGKIFFSLNLLSMYLSGLTTDFALVVIGGDFFFVTVFLVFFFRLKQFRQTWI